MRFSVPSSSLMPPATVSCGQSCVACHQRFGAGDRERRWRCPRRATNLRSTERGPRISTAISRAASGRTTRYLFSSAMPGGRGRARPTSGRRRCGAASPRTGAITIQASRSYVAVDAMWPMPRGKPATAVQTAAKDLGAAVAAEFAGDQRDHDDRRGGGQRRDTRAYPSGCCRRSTSRCGEQWSERRLVGEAPGQVLGGDEEVQLVAMVAVPTGQRSQYDGDRGGDRGLPGRRRRQDVWRSWRNAVSHRGPPTARGPAARGGARGPAAAPGRRACRPR